MLPLHITPSLFDYKLSDPIDESLSIDKLRARLLAEFFASSPLFNWPDNNNGCEARADAICLLLKEWGVASYKAWLFSGLFLKKHFGGLKQNWNYHVAAMIPVEENGVINLYVIDPATSDVPLQKLKDWAEEITAYPHSYIVTKKEEFYIFNEKKIENENWYKRDKQNRKWLIQGLAGINGLTTPGKAAIAFHKNRIRNKAMLFDKIKKEKPL